MAKKQAKNAKPVPVKLPAGFSAVSLGGEFGDFHDFTKQAILTGKIVGFGSIDGEFGKQRTMQVQNGKKVSTVTESKALANLFDEGKKIKGRQVFIQYLGSVKVGKPRRDGTQKTFKRFAAALK